jgi:hypothetical protein
MEDEYEKLLVRQNKISSGSDQNKQVRLETEKFLKIAEQIIQANLIRF